MTSIDLFIKYIQRAVTLSGEELTELLAAFNLKKIKKKQFIIQPEFTAKYRTCIEGGFPFLCD